MKKNKLGSIPRNLAGMAWLVAGASRPFLVALLAMMCISSSGAVEELQDQTEEMVMSNIATLSGAFHPNYVPGLFSCPLSMPVACPLGFTHLGWWRLKEGSIRL